MGKNSQTDLRVKKTKRAIRNALFQLAQEKNVSKITVKELVERAEINKTTFYTYYESIYDLIDMLEQEIIDLVLNRLEGVNLLFDNPNLIVESFYMELREYQIENLARFHAFDTVFMNKMNEAIRPKLLENGIDIGRYYSLIVFIFKGIIELAIRPEPLREEEMEQLKVFIQGGLEAVKNSKMEK